MGCISSKSSTHQQVIIPNHHLLSLVPPSNTNHTIHDALERCSNFHTVKEYDDLLQRITNHNDAELAGVDPVPDTTDSACKDDSNIETRDRKKQDMEFQTVASLRQWLHAPGGGGSRRGDADAAATDYTTTKVSFSFYETNSTQGSEENSILIKTGKQEEEESIVELVAAFDKYMQQLQIDEDNFLKQIHNMIN